MVIRYSRTKGLLALVGCLAFVGLGAIFILYPEQMATRRSSPEELVFAGWLSVLFFGACFVLGLWRLRGAPALRLDERGFEVNDLLGRRRRAWSDVTGFRIEQIRSVRFVKCALRDAPMSLATLRRDLGGREITLPTYLEIPPDKVLSIMEDWRSRYSSKITAASAGGP